ncbi:unnamed protein product [Musa acuminata subsp. malaccensis]|uniref:(wild Malaysian banana) hypothetical protein n=1 Tax=Musa acuminata subsp. malaccensis TaxID=214687 RepID=A0A804L5T1_MUSAM|nr:unnamed protein product [Musa acuminata subsp. malaccensis]
MLSIEIVPLSKDTNMFLLYQLDKRRLVLKIQLVELFHELFLCHVSLRYRTLLRKMVRYKGGEQYSRGISPQTDIHLFGEAFDLSFASATVKLERAARPLSFAVQHSFFQRHCVWSIYGPLLLPI